MKPKKIGVVFPKITDKDIADLEIEKIRVSKKTEEKNRYFAWFLTRPLISRRRSKVK